ncbi:MAG: type 4a pilus biogenesis protein PilO [Parcubacteria group bacterium]|nr:type 4a pilus biogenesis protein PilO [Parcubacteria group bacterium]
MIQKFCGKIIEMSDFRKAVIIKTAIAGGGAVFLLAAAIFAVFHINKQIAEIQNLRQIIQSRVSSVESIALLRRDSEKAAAATNIINNALPTKDNIIGFSREMDRLARENGVQLGFSFTSETEAAPDRLGDIGFTATTQSSYQSLTKFLKTLEASRFIVNVRNVDAVRSGELFNAVIKGTVSYRQ